VDNEWARAINLWFEHVKEGYIGVFVVECNESFYGLTPKKCNMESLHANGLQCLITYIYLIIY
jgi:hypothetical protein